MSNGDLSSLFGGGGFDTNSVEPQSDYDVLPAGKYPVLIEKAEVKQTQNHNGHYIKLTLAPLDDPYKNRKVFDNINIDNPNKQCVEIGLRQLAALGQAIGVAAITDTSQLVNKACIAHVKVRNEQNEVRTYSPLNPPSAPGAPQQSAPQQPQYPPQQPQYGPPQQPAYQPPQQPAYQPPQQQQPAGNKPPWAR